MIEFHQPGSYCLRTPTPTRYMLELIQQWSAQAELPEMQSLGWLTTAPKSDLEERLWPMLSRHTSRLNGLDVIRIQEAHEGGTVRELVNLLGRISPLRPGVIFVEKLEQWLSGQSKSLVQMDPAQQIQFLNRWCRTNRITLVALLPDELPSWAAFTQGISQLNDTGELQFKPWWLEPWGYSGSLWHMEFPEQPVQVLMDSEQFNNLGGLARALYQFRLSCDPDTLIHVHLSNWRSAGVTATALLRLGADSVIENFDLWQRREQAPSTSLEPFQNKSDALDDNLLESFAVTLQETFSPGQLKLLPAHAFSSQSLMLSRLANDWGVHCSLSRLSLLNHINPLQAAKLANLLSLQASGLVTGEALYLFKIWGSPPTGEQIDAYLSTCFNVPMATLFAGSAHYLQEDNMRAVLRSLSNYEAAFISDQQEDAFAEQANSLDEIWFETKDTSNSQPWVGRLAGLAGISHLIRGSQLHTEEG